MIWVHTFYTGKFNNVMHKRVYDNYAEASKQYEVLGGTLKAYIPA